MTAPMPRLVPLACLLALLLAPAAAQAAGRARHGEGAVARRCARRAPAPARYVVDLDSRAARSTRGARGRRGCRPRSRSSTRPRPRCGGSGPAARLATERAGRDGARRAGVVGGDLYLRGSGDPTFDAIDAGQPRPAGRRRGDRRGHRPRDRRRVGVRQPAAACRPRASALTSEVGAAVRADVQPRPHRPPRAVLAGRPAQLRRDGVRQAAARRSASTSRAARGAGVTPEDGRAGRRAWRSRAASPTCCA